jgi:glutathione S-transferase
MTIVLERDFCGAIAHRGVYGFQTNENDCAGETMPGREDVMRLHDSRLAPNPRRVRVFLAEKGIAVPLVPVDLGKLEQREPGFRALNPVGEIPVLEFDDGTALTETIAICRYFEETRPDPALFGTGARERALVEMWQRRIEFDLFWRVAQAFRHLHPAMRAMEVPQVPEWGEANKPRAAEALARLDAHLADGRAFVCGDAYTVADITALCAVDFMRPARIAMPDGLGALKAWHARVSARPSAGA